MTDTPLSRLKWIPGRPLESRAVVVNLIANTRTDKGLEILVALDETPYQTGYKVRDEQMAALRIIRDEFHGEWNYRLEPSDHKKCSD
jgi:hypothetical protein